MAKLKRKKKRTRIDQKDKNVRIRHVLQMHDILTIVFRNLNGRDLSTAAMVCRSWLEAANHEKRIRRPYCFVTQFSTSNQDEIFSKYITQSTIKPFVGIFFMCVRCLSEAPKAHIIFDLLPKNCQPIIVLSRRVTFNEKCLHFYLTHSSYLVCALLPQISDVKINIIEVIGGTDVLRKYYYKKYKRIIKKVADRDDETCLMLFSDSNGYKIGNKMHLFARSRFKKKNKIISLCDTLASDVFTKNTINSFYDPTPLCVAVLITGAIKTWSIVVDRTCNTKEQFEEKLKLFKKQIKLQQHSMGFMFNYKSDDNVTEREMFAKLFPKVPIIGCFSCYDFDECPYRKWKCCCLICKHKRYMATFIAFMILTYN